MKLFHLVPLLIVGNVDIGFAQETFYCKWVGLSYICSQQVPTTNSSDTPQVLPDTVVCGASFSCEDGPESGSNFIEVPDAMLALWRTNKSPFFVAFPKSTDAKNTESMRKKLEAVRLQIEDYRVQNDRSGSLTSGGKLDQYRLGIDAYKNSIKIILPSKQ